MIKSYKIVLIIQMVLILIGFFVSKGLYYSDYDQISRALVLLFGSSPLVIAGFSVLIQKIIVEVINSDSTIEEVNKQTTNDKFWRNSFLVTIILGVLTLIISIVGLCSEIEIGVKNGAFMFNFSVSLLTLTISSLTIGILLRVRESINEVAKLLGFLLGVIAVIIFSACLFLVSSESLWVTSYKPDSLYGTLVSFFDKEDSRSEETGTKNTFAERESEGDEEGTDENDFDYYEFYKMNFSNVEIKDNLNHGKSDIQSLFKLFLAKYLKLAENQSFNGFRIAIQNGVYFGEFPDINAIDEKLRLDPVAIRETFDNYNPMLYAFLSEKIYFGSNLNLIVDALINSHEDIYGTENPEESLNKIYKIMFFGGKKDFPEYYYEKLSPYVSENVRNSIKKDAETNANKDNYVEGHGQKMSTIWIYSFWARRYKEKNIDVVFEILKEIKEHYEGDNPESY